jgi:stage II sporulation protein D
MVYRKLLFCMMSFLLAGSLLLAADIRIGLFHKKGLQSVVFTVVEGEYILYGNNSQVAVARKGSIFHIERKGSGLTVQDTQKSYGVFNSLDINGISTNNVFLIKPVLPSQATVESDDNLSVGVFNDELRLINRLDMEKYIAGTVESEGGPNATIEYYKAQAVLVRTYAHKNFHRHAHEGFNLCDNVHCQAYKGKSRLNKTIYAATLATQNQILADNSGEPVVTAYHASCGGITANAAMEWNKDLPYLAPVKDPFCDGSAHRTWSKSIPLAEWNKYLQGRGFSPAIRPTYKVSPVNRQKFLDSDKLRLPLTDIREDLKLKSSFFTVVQENSQVVLTGHGYGHGLGLCQEGAIEMSRVGYSYVDILMFYFHGLKLVTP